MFIGCRNEDVQNAVSSAIPLLVTHPQKPIEGRNYYVLHQILQTVIHQVVIHLSFWTLVVLMDSANCPPIRSV
jgi:hypothetical protein